MSLRKAGALIFTEVAIDSVGAMRLTTFWSEAADHSDSQELSEKRPSKPVSRNVFIAVLVMVPLAASPGCVPKAVTNEFDKRLSRACRSIVEIGFEGLRGVVDAGEDVNASNCRI